MYLLGILASLLAIHVIQDFYEGAEAEHELLEAAVLVPIVAGVALLWRSLAHAEQQVHQLSSALAASQGEAVAWRAEAHQLMEGLGLAIGHQFDRWALSDAEKDVGMLLIRGLGIREIADARATSERTVKQQAQAVYRKAGLAGRNELAAFFLAELLVPGSNRKPDRSAQAQPPTDEETASRSDESL